MMDHDNSVDALTANPKTDKEFASGSHDRTIKIYDSSTFKVRQTLKGHEDGIWSLVYSHDGSSLLSTSPDRSARIWDVRSGKQSGIL